MTVTERPWTRADPASPLIARDVAAAAIPDAIISAPATLGLRTVLAAVDAK